MNIHRTIMRSFMQVSALIAIKAILQVVMIHMSCVSLHICTYICCKHLGCDPPLARKIDTYSLTLVLDTRTRNEGKLKIEPTSNEINW